MNGLYSRECHKLTSLDLVRQAEEQLNSLIERPQRFPEQDFPVWTLPAVLIYESRRELWGDRSIEDFVGLSPKLALTDLPDCGHEDLRMCNTYQGVKRYMNAELDAECTPGFNVYPKLDGLEKLGSKTNANHRILEAMEWTTNFRHSSTTNQGVPFGLDEISRGTQH